jgi:Rrf2 family protein
MKLTRSAGYALVAVGHIARTGKTGTVLAKSIAKQYKIPLDYLLKILQQMVRADILDSIRGPRGGFLLARSPAKITVLQIIEAVDGPFITEPSLCSAKSDLGYSKKIGVVYGQASKQAAQILGKATVASLIPGLKTAAKKKK